MTISGSDWLRLETYQQKMEHVCQRLDEDSQLITLFAENYSPINCRSSLEGVFHFDYQVRKILKDEIQNRPSVSI